MSSFGLQCSTSVPSKGRRTRKASAMIPSRRAEFFAKYQRQAFSLPDSVMFYVAKNPPSPNFYEKMIQTCKYFFVKNPVLVTSKLAYSGDGKWELDLKKPPIDLSKVYSKLWITDRLDVNPVYSDNEKAVIRNIISSVILKIYQCDAKYVSINHQIISCHDFSFLITAAEEIYYRDTIVNDENGTNVPVEKIFEVAFKVKKITFFCNSYQSDVTSETMKKLLKIPHFSKLGYFCFVGIPENFDIETFYSYMKKNKSTKFDLIFLNSISEVYKNRLEQIVDEILSAETHDYKPPFFTFTGINGEKWLELHHIFITHI